MRKNEAKWIESRQRWQINIQSDGERRTFSDSTPGKKGKIACEKKSDEWIEKKLETNPRFDAAWKDFLAEKQATTGEANYIKLESLGRLWITSEMKRKRLSDITFQAWQNCVNAAGKAGKSKRTCVNIRAVITAFSLYAKKNRWKLEPPEFLTIPKNAPIGKRNILQPSDFKALFSEDTITHYGKTQ